jgi:hypothetical protein
MKAFKVLDAATLYYNALQNHLGKMKLLKLLLKLLKLLLKLL